MCYSIPWVRIVDELGELLEVGQGVDDDLFGHVELPGHEPAEESVEVKVRDGRLKLLELDLAVDLGKVPSLHRWNHNLEIF